MPTINEAKFTINGTASTDPTTGDPGFNASTSQTLTLTAEQNPSGALSLLYEVFDPNDSQSPLASKDATLLTFVGSGTASQTVANPNSSITIITAASGVHSWIIRCTASTPAGSSVFERIVSIRTATSPAIRKPVSAETGQYEAREHLDTVDDIVDVVSAGGAASVTVRKNSGANVGMRPRLNFIEGTNITLTVADDAPNTEVDITIAAPSTLNFWQRAATTLSPVTGGDDVQITDDAKITTNSNNNLNLIPNGTGFTIVGAGATSHTLNTSNDLLVSGELEVNGPLFVDGGLKDADVVTAIALGDGSNLALTTTNKTIVGGINELDLRIDTAPFLNGSILEDHTITVTSDGATVTLSLEKAGGGDLSLIFDGALTAFDATPIATIALTAGTDTAPELNYIFIPKSTGLLTANTTGFSTTEQIAHIATVVCQSAASLQPDDALKVHAWTDHMSDTLGRGHVTHINEWIRGTQHAWWKSGVVTTPTVGVMTFDVAISSGKVFQLHELTYPAFDTSTGSDIYIVNDNATAFKKVGDLTGEITDSQGVSMSGKYFSLVIWGVQSETSSESKLMCNLPSGSYNTSATAIADASRFTDFTIPADFKGAGFLIARLTVRHQVAGGGTWTVELNESLLGQFPQTGAGGSAAATVTFPDNVFRIFDEADNTKNLAFQVSGVTTATTRTLTIQDLDGTIALTGTAVSIGDDLTLAFGDSTDTVLEFDTGQTVDALLFALDSTSRSVVIIEEGDRGFNFAHAAQTNPTVFVHSANQSTTEWASLTHNQTNALLSSGTGMLITTASANNINLVPGLTGITVVGDSGATSHTLIENDDLFINGKIEVDGISYFDGLTNFANDIVLATTSAVYVNTDFGAIQLQNASQTPDAPMLLTGNSVRHWIVAEWADRAFDFAHAQQTNPTVFVHSANQATDEWISFTHDQTNALISSGTGVKITTTGNNPITLLPDGTGITIIGDAGATSHSLNTNDDLFVSGKLEVDGILYVDSRIATGGNVGVGGGDSSVAMMVPHGLVQTPDSAMLFTGSLSRAWIIADRADQSFDFAHAQQTNPTMFVHSANQATDEWLSLTHDQTDAVIGAGSGSIKLDAAVIIGGDLDLNQNSIELDPSPTADDTANGEIITDTVDVNAFGQWAALHIDTDGNWIEAHADAATDMPCLALAIESGVGSKKLLLKGFARNDAWTWTPGGAVYVSESTSGGLTQTAPSADGEQVQVVGYAKTADILYFNPSQDVLELQVP